MSTWISDLRLRRAVLILSLLSLAACGDTGAPGLMGFRTPGTPKGAALSKVQFYRGAVVVAGPAGYCVDRRSVRRGGEGGFALLISCAALAEGAPPPSMPALVTVSVLPHDARTQAPRASDIAARLAPVKPLAEIDRDGIALVHLPQGGDRGVPGGDPRYWRAGMMVGGHLVGLAAYGRRGSAVAGPEGRDLLIELARRIRAASPTPAQDPAPATTAPEDVDTVTRRPGGIRGILPGLFPKAG